MVGWLDYWRIKLSQLPTKLKFKFKLSLAIACVQKMSALTSNALVLEANENLNFEFKNQQIS